MDGNRVARYQRNLSPREQTVRLLITQFIGRAIRKDSSYQAIIEFDNWPWLFVVSIPKCLDLLFSVLGMCTLSTATVGIPAASLPSGFVGSFLASYGSKPTMDP